MEGISRDHICIAERVSRAINEGTPIVALESTVIAHGLPHPLNLDTALACEQAVLQRGATPATLGVISGIPTVGVSEDEIDSFATGQTPGGSSIEKVGLNNLAAVMVKRSWGATTVASSLKLAHLAGIRVFATGGIGGVHRGVAETLDISADLTALAKTPVICVCAGAKAILDLPKTLEYLETFGIPVVGYGTDEFPPFYSRTSGLPVDVKVDTTEEAAEVAACHWRMGSGSAVLVCAPVPSEFEIPMTDIERACAGAIAMAKSQSIRGKALTPFLLSQLEGLTGGMSLQANRALLLNNAGLAANIAVSLSKMQPPKNPAS